MKIRYMSDLHLEFLQSPLPAAYLQEIRPGPDEACILAGDIGDPYSANYLQLMRYMSANFKRTYVVAGNHEYYNNGRSVAVTTEYLVEFFEQFTNVRFLNNEAEVYEGFVFVGTTLWSHIADPRYTINDVTQISGLDVVAYNKLHAICVDFLRSLAQERLVIITHHVPSRRLIKKEYLEGRFAPYNQWFSCDLDELIRDAGGRIVAWFYGHTHSAGATRLDHVPFFCNPIGYPRENVDVDFNKTVELE
jgi:predicted phosphodiesterase